MIVAASVELIPPSKGRLADGRTYRLWLIQCTFRNAFDLHRFPFDGQTLSMPFQCSGPPRIASLQFPVALVKEKVTIAITTARSVPP
jgi:hypothetical protein